LSSRLLFFLTVSRIDVSPPLPRPAPPPNFFSPSLDTLQVIMALDTRLSPQASISPFFFFVPLFSPFFLWGSVSMLSPKNPQTLTVSYFFFLTSSCWKLVPHAFQCVPPISFALNKFPAIFFSKFSAISLFFFFDVLLPALLIFSFFA